MATLLEERIVLVTGAGRGIGRGIAEALGEAGAAVVVTDLDREMTGAAETAERVIAAGGRALALAMDVTDEAAVEEALAQGRQRLGGEISGLVNNAGLLRMAPALETSADDWDRQWRINVEGVARCSRICAHRWIEEAIRGSIVNVASNAGKVGYPNMAAYNATKAAVISLTRSLAAEWAAHGINVNAVCPGGVATPMLSEVAAWIGERTGEDADGILTTMVPPQLGRHVEPVEIGRIVAFLLSEHAAIVRGQALNVDGGETPY